MQETEPNPAQALVIPQTPRAMPLWRIVLTVLGDLGLALIFMITAYSQAAGWIPQVHRLWSERTETYRCARMPASDRALQSWAEHEHNYGSMKVHRNGATLELKYRLKTGAAPLYPDWKRYGYIVKGKPVTRSRNTPEGTASGDLLLGSVLYLVIGGVGVRRIIKIREADRERLAPEIPTRKALAYGALLGLPFFALNVGYIAGVSHFIQEPPHTLDVLTMLLDLPVWAVIGTCLLGVVLAPIVEEIFMRGALFGLFAANGQVVTGAIVSSLFFAACHGIDRAFPMRVLLGLACAWLYRRHRTLAAPIGLHAANNALAFALTLLSNGRY